MKILAIDTATENCSAALLIDGHIIARERLLERGHADLILPMVSELLAEAGTSLKALTAVAFGQGPGGFTGVRLAASVAQGLAFGAGLPVVPVSDLRALAQRVMTQDPDVAGVLACTDARMREVYWGCFERSVQGLAGALGDEHVSKPSELRLPEAWSGTGHASRVWGAGSGFTAYPELRATLGAVSGRVLEGIFPRALEIAQLAAPEAAAGRFLPAEQALPVYLRDDVTQVPERASLN